MKPLVALAGVLFCFPSVFSFCQHIHSVKSYGSMVRSSSSLACLVRPIVTLKLAVDSQGAVDDLSKGDSWRFTSSSSLDLVHRLRAVSDGASS